MWWFADACVLAATAFFVAGAVFFLTAAYWIWRDHM